MQTVQSSSDCSPDALAAALAGLSLSPAQHAASIGHANGHSGHAEPAPSDRPSGQDTKAAGTSGAEPGSDVFDPPAGRAAKAGATRIIPGGYTAYYWWVSTALCLLMQELWPQLFSNSSQCRQPGGSLCKSRDIRTSATVPVLCVQAKDALPALRLPLVAGGGLGRQLRQASTDPACVVHKSACSTTHASNVPVVGRYAENRLAACACRCGWDCATGGYDDDSQPLPPHRAKWEEFTAHIKAGRTAPYAGKVEGSKRSKAAKAKGSKANGQ